MTETGDTLYKERYIIAFYDKEDEYLLQVFNNPREICKYLKWEINTWNITRIQRMITHSALNHTPTTLLGGPMMVHLIEDTDEDKNFEEKEDNALCQNS